MKVGYSAGADGLGGRTRVAEMRRVPARPLRSLLFCSVVACSGHNEDLNASKGNAIENGRPAAANDVNLVQITRTKDNSNEVGFCGGVALTDEVVLTAGHWFQRRCFECSERHPGHSPQYFGSCALHCAPRLCWACLCQGEDPEEGRIPTDIVGIDLGIYLLVSPLSQLPAQPLLIDDADPTSLIQATATITVPQPPTAGDDRGVYAMESPIVAVEPAWRGGRTLGPVGSRLEVPKFPNPDSGLLQDTAKGDSGGPWTTSSSGSRKSSL